jgi:hypothetical protein
MVGQTVGKYRVVSRLGQGGMGTVYKAVDETLEREVAIKCLNPGLAEPDILKRFRAEAITLARLNHPHIATLFELTEHAGDLLMVMEFVRGETFDKVSAQLGPMSVDRAARLCGQVLDALAYAHRAGIVHRDLKPANLMLTESGLAKVMDFGLARMTGTEHLTVEGFMMGTPAYMAPEQVLGGEVDGRTDLYAMGVVLYRLLTAHLPFKADSGIAMVHKQVYDPPTPARQFRADLPLACQEMLTRAMAKAPADRYQTAEEFRDALAALNGAGATDSTATRVMPTPERSPDLDLTLPMPTPIVMAQPTMAPPSAAVAVPAQIAPAPAAPKPAPSAPPPGTRRALVAAIGILLFAGAATVAIVMSRAKGPAPDPDTAVRGGAPAAPAATTPAAEPAAANPSPALTVAAPIAAPPASATAPAALPPKAATPRRTEPVAARAASSTRSAAPAVRAGLPIVTFGNIRLLVSSDGKVTDREATLRFGADGLQVVDGTRTIHSTAYQDIIGLFHSHSREPRWATPGGVSAPVAKAGGKFSFLKGTPDWITVRTKDLFIPLRVQGDDLDRVIGALEARTGSKVVRTR